MVQPAAMGRAERRTQGVGDGSARLTASVLVPVRNEEASLPELIEALRRQTFQPAEVVIVNGGSVDRTAEVFRRLSEGDDRFRLLDVGTATPGRGRNVGAAAAQNEWVAFTDAGARGPLLRARA